MKDSDQTSSKQEPAHTNSRSTWLIRLIALLPITVFGYMYGSYLIPFLGLALYIPFDRSVKGQVRKIAILGLAIIFIPSMVLFVGGGPIGYLLNRGEVYEQVRGESALGLRVEVVTGGQGCRTRKLLPNLEIRDYGGPYYFTVFLHDDNFVYTHGRIKTAELVYGNGEVVGDVRFGREVRWYLESRQFPDGWIPFQRKVQFSNSLHELESARCGNMMTSPPLHLDRSRRSVFLRLRIQAKNEQEIMESDVEIELRPDILTNSGLTIAS